MKKTLINIFASLSIAIPLMAIYAILIGFATFIENDYGTQAARTLVYNTWFFNILHLWLLICLIGVIIRNKFIQRKKYMSFILHTSFVIIIVGAGITRFYGKEGIINLREGETSSSYVSSDNYFNFKIKEGSDIHIISVPANINYASNKTINKTINFGNNSLIIKSDTIKKLSNDKNNNIQELKGSIEYKDKIYPISLIGGEGINKDININMNNIEISINWGAKIINLPFSLKLNDFILDRYPGSMSPSSYKSKITLKDTIKKVEKDYDIYMNNTLDYGGYRFFQASYDEDEKGTILSINNDPGKIPTYIGYFLLILGSIGVIFDRNARFRKLGKYLKTQTIYSILFLTLFLVTTPLIANENTNKNILQTIELLRKNSKEHSKLFASLQVQSFDGRIKPIDTLSSELVHKITGKNGFIGLSNTQILLGMLIYPDYWKNIKIIKVSTNKLKEIIGTNIKDKYISFSDLLSNNGYKLINYVEEANRKKPANRDKFDNDVIEVDERLNIVIGIFSGDFLRIFPFKSNNENIDKIPDVMAKEVLKGNFWLNPITALQFSKNNHDNIKNMLLNYFDGVIKGINENKWDEANIALKNIQDYQTSNTNLNINKTKLKTEILLNNTNIFEIIILPYIIIGILSLIIVFIYIFTDKKILLKILKVLYYLLTITCVLHIIGLMLRWYIGEHAPWSNAYESMLYISFIASILGVIVFKRSYLAISASSFLAGISLFVANLGFMNPQIGNLVPVLKSYWLNIHVSIITSSYGFLSLCFLLGLITLITIAIKNERLKSIINSMVVINEMSMTLGLLLLTVGNFLGGIWANESWGRYWGWDPKETWALVSILVYAIVLHLRFITKKNFQYIFSVASVISFLSIIMTYFGVNYYLDGLHSYAAGDPLPIPKFLYYMLGTILIIILAAFKNRKMDSIII